MKYILSPILLCVSIFTSLIGLDFDPSDYKDFKKIGTLTHNVLSENQPNVCMPPDYVPDPQSPHVHDSIVYYANSLGANIYLPYIPKIIDNKRLLTLPWPMPKFPIGTIIVKEKWDNKNKSKPTVITVMQKINDNDNETSWRFEMYDTNDYKNITSKFLAYNDSSCVECHVKWKKNDYISNKGADLFFEYAKAAARP